MKTLALLLFFNIIGHGALVMFLFQSQSLLSPLFDIRCLTYSCHLQGVLFASI